MMSSVPPEMTIGWLEVRLANVSVVTADLVIGAETAMLMAASSPACGEWPSDQFPPVSQSPPPAAIQVSVESNRLISNCSIANPVADAMDRLVRFREAPTRALLARTVADVVCILSSPLQGLNR